MNLSRNKKILILGLVVFAGLAYFYMQKKSKKNTLVESPEVNTLPVKDNYTVTVDSPGSTGAVYLVLGGKKYPFISEKAFTNYGYSKPEVITSAELEAIKTGGFVSEDGKVIASS
jgi:lipopolysaccharide export system protein LptC